jgi:hypothetical protein
MGITFSNEKSEQIMSEFYIKNNGKYIPISFDKICTKEWAGKLMVVKIGNGNSNFDEMSEEIDNTWEAIKGSAAVYDCLNNKTSFIFTTKDLDFDMLSNITDLDKQNILIKISNVDDLSQIQKFITNIKHQLSKLTKKVVVLPTPLTVGEYKELMEIKKRCDLRRDRRGT